MKKQSPGSETAMDGTISVNEAIDRLAWKPGAVVAVSGILSFEFEDVSLNHFPISERREGYGSSVWLSAGTGSIQLNEQVLKRWHGKRVVVTGTIHGSYAGFGGCGHMSLYAADLLVASIDRP
ncbi:hypothetical protein [Dyella subtropica]|uniref:hypothetical protein n=1 Tax=Dyella subtropica TaxID=2992127 RepID=UPI00225A8019|nr:hypothetical protein [Dyella subtropica]